MMNHDGVDTKTFEMTSDVHGREGKQSLRPEGPTCTDPNPSVPYLGCYGIIPDNK